MHNAGTVMAVFEPTHILLRDVWMRSFDDFLEEMEIEHDFRVSPQPEYVIHTHPLGPPHSYVEPRKHGTGFVVKTLARFTLTRSILLPGSITKGGGDVLSPTPWWSHTAAVDGINA